jgi:hypothetical protein
VQRSTKTSCPASHDAVNAQLSRPPRAHSPAISTYGKAALNAGPAISASSVQAPPGPRRERLPLWVPIGILIVAFSSSLFAYLTLLAPAPPRIEKRAGERNQATKGRPIAASGDEIRKMMALAPERFRPTPPEAHLSPGLPPSPQSIVRSPTPRLPKKTSTTEPSKQSRTISATPRPNATIATAAIPATAGAAEGVALETKPAPRSATSEAGAALEPSATQMARSAQRDSKLAAVSLKEPPAIMPPQEELPAPAESVQGGSSTAIRSVHTEPLAARSPRQEASRPTNDWLTRMRLELDFCGKPGLWRSDLCRETVRWKYCHPNAWDAVRECSVERFASSPLQN